MDHHFWVILSGNVPWLMSYQLENKKRSEIYLYMYISGLIFAYEISCRTSVCV